MKRTPIAHVVWPLPDLVRPVPEFSWAAVQHAAELRSFDLEVVIPLPYRWLRTFSSWRRQQKGRFAWPTELDARLLELVPTPRLVPYVPLPGRSIEAAAAALAMDWIRKPRASRPQLIQGSFLDISGFIATSVAEVLDCQSLAVAHGSDMRVLLGQIPDAGRKRRAKMTVEKASHIVVMSQSMQTALRAHRENAVALIPFAAQAARFPCAPFSSFDQPTQAPLELLFVGRIERAKGVLELLQALAQLPDRTVRVRLVGPDCHEFDLDQEIRACGLEARVSVEGSVPQHELNTRYHAAAVVVLPSHAEGLPCVLVEALLSGRPVVATRVGGVPELVDGSVGALVEPHHAEALAHALTDVLDRVRARAFEPERLRKRALPFSWEVSAPKLAGLYDDVLRQPDQGEELNSKLSTYSELGSVGRGKPGAL